MSRQILSQAEVDSLLDNLEASTKETLRNTMVAPESGEDKDVHASQQLGEDQLQALRRIHNVFGKRLAAELSTALRGHVEVELASLIQSSYGDFVENIESPTYFGAVQAAPFTVPWILEISPVVLYPMIDRLLGGRHVYRPQARRPLTEIELRLTSRITTAILTELANAWESIVLLDVSIVRIESDPHLARTLPSNELVVQIGFNITVDSIQDTAHICIPLRSIEHLHGELASAFSKSAADTADESTVELVVTLAEATITAKEFKGLSVGDIIMTDTKATTPVGVSVDGTERFRASPGASDGKKAVEIKDVL